MVIDLDAHQGDGHEVVFADDSRAIIFDMYSHPNFPNGSPAAEEAKSYANKTAYPNLHRILIPVALGTKTDDYLKTLKKELPKAIKETKPDYIIYNAGTDIYEKDQLGGLSVSFDGVLERDDFVVELATTNNIPIMWLLSGGYTAQSASMISKSLHNCINKYFKKLPTQSD